MVSVQTPDAPVLSVRLESPAGSTTRTCRFVGDGFTLDEDGASSRVPAHNVVDVLTRETVPPTPDEDDLTIAAVITADGEAFLHALAHRRDGGWTDLRHALDPVATTWDDVRAALVGATVALMTAVSANHETAGLR